MQGEIRLKVLFIGGTGVISTAVSRQAVAKDQDRAEPSTHQ